MKDSCPRVVVVTGGSKGIGRAIALKFAEEKAKIIIAHYDPDNTAADISIMELKAAGAAVAESYRIDVSSFSAVSEFFKDIIARHGTVDVLINNAGITKDGLLMRMDEAAWDMVISVNLKSVFNCCSVALKTMVKNRRGRIVSISSVVGEIGNAGQANYSASKAGIMGFTKSVAREVASRGITVNAVAPGYINTEMTAVLSDKVKDEFVSKIPLARMGEAKDVAEAVHWLCSESASYITGQVLHVSGGMFM